MKVFSSIKGINIVIGCICLGLESHVYSDTQFIIAPDIDIIFLIVVASAIVESAIALLTEYHYKDVPFRYSILDTIQRGVTSVAVLVAGGLLIYSAVDVRNNCWKYSGITVGEVICQPFDAKLAAGILCVINGVFYGIAKKDLGQAFAPGVYGDPTAVPNYPGGAPLNFTVSPMQQVSQGPTIISQNTSFTNPGGYHEPNIQIPRFQTQNPSGYQYNQNYNQNQMSNQIPNQMPNQMPNQIPNQMPMNYPQRHQQQQRY